jgi:hypothetical protein
LQHKSEDISSTDQAATLHTLLKENEHVKASNMKLEQQLVHYSTSKLSEENFRKYPDKLLFYTGIKSCVTFFALCDLIYPLLAAAKKLSKFDRIIIFFLKIRLNLMEDDIAYRYINGQPNISFTVGCNGCHR